MQTEIMWCEDCQEEVVVYGGPELYTREFIEVERDGHDDHDLSRMPSLGEWT